MNIIGSTCTPSAQSAQGTCPTGYLCEEFMGGHGPFCTKQCTSGAGDTCGSGYTGPGKPECIITATSGSGSGSGSAIHVCGIICADTTAGMTICGSGGECNGMCPGTLTCSQPLTAGSGSAVGSACF